MDLILPGDPGFEATLGALTPGWQQVAAATNGDFAFVARADTGLLEPVSWSEAVEYMEGGELEERETFINRDSRETSED